MCIQEYIIAIASFWCRFSFKVPPSSYKAYLGHLNLTVLPFRSEYKEEGHMEGFFAAPP